MTESPAQRLAAQSAEAAKMLRVLANEQRLLILCHLLAAGEMPVSALIDQLTLSQSALSQHLARLRDEGVVTYRREAQSLIYTVADDKASQLLALLSEIYCPELTEKG